MNKNKHVNFCIVLLQVIKTEYPAVFKEKIGNKGMVKWDKQKHNIPIRVYCAAAVYCLGDKFDQYQISTLNQQKVKYWPFMIQRGKKAFIELLSWNGYFFLGLQMSRLEEHKSRKIHLFVTIPRTCYRVLYSEIGHTYFMEILIPISEKIAHLGDKVFHNSNWHFTENMLQL